MPNYGTTTITITGPEQDRAALRAALAETAYNKLAFRLMHAAPDIWCGDGLMRNADILDQDNTLTLVSSSRSRDGHHGSRRR